MTAPLVRVVVVTYASGDVLTSFLDTLGHATDAPVEVVVADNGDDAVEPDRTALARGAQVVRTGSNLGYGAAANLGADGATTEWIVVANPDVMWDHKALDALIEAGRRWPRAGCLGPAIRTPAGALYPSARAFPSLGRGVGHALFGWWWPANPWTKSYRAEAGSPEEGTTGWLSGSLMLLRRSAFEEVRGFDPTYFMYCEDMDLCRRLADAGWSSVYVPSAVVMHSGGHATQRAPDSMLREHHRSLFRYLARQYSGPRYAPLRAVLGVGLLVRYLLARRVPSLAAGAEPTRSADLLDGRPGGQ